MPKNSPVPYLRCKPVFSSLFVSGKKITHCEWSEASESDVNAAEEISGYLMRKLSESYKISDPDVFKWQHEALEMALTKLDQSVSKYAPSYKIWAPTFKLSFELFDELDAKHLVINDAVMALMSHINLLVEKSSILINFSEVFLVKEGENPPPECRLGIDICVPTMEEYKKHTQKLSYQLAKAIFNTYTTEPKQKNVVPAPTKHSFLRNKSQFSRELFCDLNTPLNQLFYFKSNLEADIFFIKDSNLLINEQSLIVAFDSNVSLSELSFIRHIEPRIHLNEIIIVLRGAHYQLPEEREKVYQQALQLLDTINCRVLLQVILLPKETNQNVLTLAPNSPVQDGAFKALTQNAGYYLNADEVFNRLYRNRWQQILENNSIPQMKQADGLKQNTSQQHQTPTYIYREQETVDFRKSKQLNRQALKANVALAMNLHQDLNQTQALSQNQVLSQTQELTKQQIVQEKQGMSFSFTFGWRPFLYMKDMCDKLKSYAEDYLKNRSRQKHLINQIYLTQFYRQNHSKDHYIEQIAIDETFRAKLVAKFFGVAYSKSGPVYLTNYSLDSIDDYLKEYFTDKLYYFIGDGLDPSTELTLNSSLTGGRQLSQLPHFHSEQFSTPICSMVSSLALLTERDYATYRDNLNYRLVHDRDNLAPDLINQIESLLNVFRINVSLNPQQIKELEAQYLDLIKNFYPHYPHFAKNLEKLFTHFDDHNIDNLRILMQGLMSCDQDYWWHFFELLGVLDSRCLLKNFYLIYFKYTHDVFSIAHLFENFSKIKNAGVWQQKSNAFVKLIELTPTVSSAKDWPLFEKFAHHYIIFAVKNGQPLQDLELQYLQGLWQRLWVKFLLYSDSKEQEAQALMESLVNHLIRAEGLNLAPLKHSITFGKALEKLIDNAISHNTLKEQLAEIGGISLAWTDVPYAIAFDHFQVVCSEMQLFAEEINPETRSYSVSLEELKDKLTNADPKTSLTKSFFRYLGKERFREEIAFYGELYGKMRNPEPDFIKELLFGYYITVTTGIHYGAAINQPQFATNFLLFLQTRKEPFAKDTVLKVIDTFFAQLSQLRVGKTATGSATLWNVWRQNNCFALVDATQPIPEILGKRFEKNQLKLFILRNAKAISDSLPALKQDQALPYTLLKNWFGKEQAADFEVTALILLQTFYPKLNMEVFMGDLFKIAQFMEAYSVLVQRGAGVHILGALNKFCNNKKNMAHLLVLIELVSDEMGDAIANTERDALCAQFLKTLAGSDRFFADTATLKPVFSIILNYYLKVNIKDISLPYLFSLVDTLIPLGMKRTIDVIQVLLKSMTTVEAYQFFSKLPQLSANELVEIAQIIKSVDDLSVTIPFLNLCVQNAINLKKNPTLPKAPTPHVLPAGLSDNGRLLVLPAKPQDAEMRRDLPNLVAVGEGNYFGYIAKLLPTLNAEHSRHLIFIGTIICSDSQVSILDALLKLKKVPLEQLKQLMHLHDLYTLKKDDFLALLDSPSIETALAQFERVKHAQNRARYQYNRDEIAKKIAQIKHRAPTGEDQVISLQEQEGLLKDYTRVMSYMADKPVLIEKNKQGIEKKFAIYELNEKQFQLLFNRLKEKIKAGVKTHDYQLMLVALCCEALYRTTNKFPRNTQILNIINTINHKSNLIHEVQTGEGKSIITALHGALLYDGERTVDIVTENNHLAWEGLHRFKPFYAYLGIPCAQNIIEADSFYQSYVQPGINYSTASNLALFRVRMTLAKKNMSTKASLICDEIDATLTTLVQFRLAETLDPKLKDLQFWSLVYSNVLAFVKDTKLFLTNKCTKAEDVTNFRTYLQLKNPNEKVTHLIKELNDDALSVLIESALVAHELEENIDYMVLTKKGNQLHSYAAPILASNKRPDPRVSYAASVQQLVHTKRNNMKPAPKYAFEVEAATETIVAVTAKNFFDFYRVNGGCIIGLTGTGGTSIELEEFYRLHGLVAFNYPTYHENLCRDLGLFAAFGSEDHLKLILKQITEHKKNSPSQPILMITSSPQETLAVKNYLAAHTNWSLQSYGGYEHDGLSEAQVIARAGQEQMITIANESLARGADINPAHPDGLLVINLGTDLTASSLRQIKGRAARNGKPGLFCSIIDASVFAAKNSTTAEIARVFQEHQRNLSLIQQKQRAKTRLLEESRHIIVNDYLLKLREQADKILNRQEGYHSVLVDNQKLKATLSEFNKNAEQHYFQLLEKHPVIEGDIATEFLAARVADYDRILKLWIPKDRFSNFKPIEPIIPLENLRGLDPLASLPIESITTLSQLLSEGWKHIGHKNMPRCFDTLDLITEEFRPYFNKERSLQYCVGQSLVSRGVIQTPVVTSTFDETKKMLVTLINEAEKLPVVGYLVPKKRLTDFFTAYLDATKTKINEKKWDELTWPDFDFTEISLWMNRISTALSIGSFVVGGPIPFILNRFVIPTLISWSTTIFNKQFANSDSGIIQVLMGLTNISTDLSNAVSAIAELTADKPMTLGIFIDKIAPLLQNQALVKVIVKFLEMSDKSHLIPYVQSMPEFLTALKPYRDRPLRELFTMEVFMQIFKEASQFNFVKQFFADTPWEGILKRISQLNSQFFAGLGKLSFNEFIKLIKVIAHPNFCEFLEKLPPQTTFAQVVAWLDMPSEKLPMEVKAVFEELRVYLANQPLIEENNRRLLTTFQEKFSLTSDKLKANLMALTPPVKEPVLAPVPVVVPPVETPWLTYAGYALSVTALVLVNVIFFSFTLLLTSLMIATWFAYPYIKPRIDLLWNPEPNKPEQVTEQDVEPIIIESVEPNVELASTPALATGKKPEASQPERQTGYDNLRLFKAQETRTAGDPQNPPSVTASVR